MVCYIVKKRRKDHSPTPGTRNTNIGVLNVVRKHSITGEQKWRLKEENKLTRKAAIEKIKKCQGYITDLNHENSLTPDWIPLENNAKFIKFRYYHTSSRVKGKKEPYFDWTNWFEIID